MDFFEQLKRTDLPRVEYPFVKKPTKLIDRLLGGYLKLFNSRIKPMKPLAWVNDKMAVYDLTQPPLDSQPATRVLRTGVDYMVLKRPAKPINMVVMINAVCDMACEHCSAQNYMGPGKKPLSFSELNDLVDQFLDMNGASLIFSGGEPTLHPKLVDLVDRVDKDKAVVSIFSNGSKLADLAPELRDAGLFGTLVSLDSHDPAIHDTRRRKPGAWNHAIAAIEAMQKNDMLVGISTYISRQGLHKGSFQNLVELGTKLGVQQIFAFDAVPSGALIDSEAAWMLTPQDREELKELIKAQNASPKGPAIMGQSWVNSAEGFGCFAGFYQLYVTASGDVCPCDFTPISFGNIRDDSLQTIWDRMRASQDWGKRHNQCRMQDQCFRKNTIDLIPPGTPWPVPYETVLKLRAQRDASACCEPPAGPGRQIQI